MFSMILTLYIFIYDFDIFIVIVYIYMKVKCDHRSKFSNLSNWKEEAWKKSGLQRDSNPWPPRYRCDALPTELWSHTLGARSIYWVHFLPCSEIVWNIYEIIHICTAVWIFFRLLLSNCLNWKIYCDDHTSLSSHTAVQTWIISYIFHSIYISSTYIHFSTYIYSFFLLLLLLLFMIWCPQLATPC